MKCPKHTAHARCTDCGAEYHVPAGFVIVPEADVSELFARRERDVRAHMSAALEAAINTLTLAPNS